MLNGFLEVQNGVITNESYNKGNGKERMMKGYIDCHKCKWSHRLYDHRGKWTGKVFCTLRNGKLKKRFRGECKYIEQEERSK